MMEPARAGRPPRGTGALVLCAFVALASACASSGLPSLPTTGGTPFPDAASAYAAATAQCSGVKTLSAELALSGRAGGQKVRGRLLGGFAEPGQVRLEAPAPFGRPVFILVIRDGVATLVLNREHRVVRDAPPVALVEALAGVPLGPDELRAAVDGCGLGIADVASGQTYPGGWARLEGSGGALWLRQVEGEWRIAAAVRGDLELRYDDYQSGRPATVRLRMTTAGADTDLTVRLTQVDINVPIDAAAFQVEIPEDAVPMTLEELRRGGPLGAPGQAVVHRARETRAGSQ
jgi:outer membrane lipoprotein-sorting protein